MKQIFKNTLVALAITIAGAISLATILPQPNVSAREEPQEEISSAYTTGSGTSTPCRYLIGMKSWDCGVVTPWTDANITSNIWLIVANFLTDIGVIAAYLVIGYVVYGGYLYMFSSGDPGKAMNGKKTLTRAFIGLAIVALSNVILNAIHIALFNNAGSFAVDCTVAGSCMNSETASTQLVTNVLNWFIATAGIVAAIFVVVGGVGYVTSSGDAGKLQKAKTTITYALIGLAIVGLAEIIVTFVSGIISNADTARTEQTLIAKEYHEN